MKSLVLWSLGALVVVPAALMVGTVLASSAVELSTGRTDVPTLTGWGKIFSLLLLATLGVAYLVWRRPVVQAHAILETSPLGTPSLPPTLVDLSLYIRTLLVVELVALAVVWGLYSMQGGLVGIDALGVFTSGAIVAFVVHLLILGQRGHDDQPG